MTRLHVLVSIAIGLGVAPLTGGPLQSAAWAQPKNSSTQSGPTVRRLERLFATRVTTVEQSCQIDLHEVLDRDLRRTNANLTNQLALLNSNARQAHQNPDPARAARIADVGAGVTLARTYLARLAKGCNPFNLVEQVQEAKRACQTTRADQLLLRMQMLSRLYKNRYDAARALGDQSTVNVREALASYQSSVRLYETANNYRAPNCGDVDSGGEAIELPGISGEPEEPPSEPSPTEGMQRQWSWIAGSWNIDRLGGQIEFRVEADGTLSAYIASTNQRMLDHGYTAGMQIMYGYQMVGSDGVTWRYWADGGYIFSAQYPDRGPGDTWGEAQWISGGIIYLPKDRDNVSFPALLANRLAGFTNPLVKPDTSALDTIIAEYNERTAALDEASTRAERMQLVQSAIEALDSQSANSADAERAAQMLGLLSEREELRDNTQLADALDTLEQSSNSADEAAAWQTLVAHMAASGAHFSQPIRGNDYDEQAAAQMFRVVRYASTLQDDLRDARGALANSNMSRTTAALARLQGIASLAGNPRNQTAGSLMEGIRNISARPSGVPGPMSAFEFPAAIATGLLDNTIAGVRASADALVDVGGAINGDRAAERRAISGARGMNTILSAPGYVDSVVRSVGNRVIERIPFARTMANWFR